MQGHPRIALVTLGLPAAFMAHHHRRKTAPVEEQQHLTAIVQMSFHGFQQLRGTAADWLDATAVDKFNSRRLSTADPLAQPVSVGMGPAQIVQGLRRRRGGTEDHRNVELLGAADRHIAGVVAHAVLLPVGGIVFLVDDDQAQIGAVAEQRGTGADQHRRAATTKQIPVAQPFGIALGRVGQQYGMSEAPPHAIHQLGRQTDLGRQQNHLPPLLDDAPHQGQVDLGLATAGHALQQVAAETIQPRRDGLHRSLLIRRQGREIGRLFRPVESIAAMAFGQPLVDQPAHRGSPVAMQLAQGLRTHAFRMVEQGEVQGMLFRRPARQVLQHILIRVQGSPAGDPLILQRLAPAQRPGQEQEQQLADRLQVIVRHPSRQFEHAFGQQWLLVEALFHCLQVIPGALAVDPLQ